MNSKCLFVADYNAGASGGDIAMDIRPDHVSGFFRLMPGYSDIRGLDTGIPATRTDGVWIVNAAGPDEAYSYEVTIYDTKRRTGDGEKNPRVQDDRARYYTRKISLKIL